MSRRVPYKTKKPINHGLLCLFLCLLPVAGCRNDMEKVHFFDDKELPQQSLDTIQMIMSKHGNVEMIMTAPKVVIYDKPQKKTEYPNGVTLRIVDKNKKDVAVVRADYACSFDEKKEIEARKNVVVIDYSTGDTSYLNSIVWNSGDHRIYSMEPVKSVNGQRVTYGDGFESDDEFRQPVILHQRGTITFEDE